MPPPSSLHPPHPSRSLDHALDQLPKPPNGIFNLPLSSCLVEDADEEVMELYMQLASTSETDSAGGTGGLGYLDPTKATLELEIDVSPLPLPLPRPLPLLSTETISPPYEPPISSLNSTSTSTSRLDHAQVQVQLQMGNENENGESQPERQRKRRPSKNRNLYPKQPPNSSLNSSKSKGKEGQKEYVRRVIMSQDLGALKGRKGDTGSVVWRSSLYLAQHLLRTLLHSSHPPPESSSTFKTFPMQPQLPLLNPTKLSSTSVLELGAGTGLLAIVLGPLFQQWTVSDKLENLSLVKKNLELNGISLGAKNGKGAIQENVGKEGVKSPKLRKAKLASSPVERKGYMDHNSKAIYGALGEEDRRGQEQGDVRIEEVDWVDISSRYRRSLQRESASTSFSTSPSTSTVSPSSPTTRLHSYPRSNSHSSQGVDAEGYDLVLAVDCIYNEHLVQPLVDTLCWFCPKGSKTIVWVVVELRSSDVLTLFLDTWLKSQWTIVRIPPLSMGDWGGQKPRWVGWVGWRL